MKKISEYNHNELGKILCCCCKPNKQQYNESYWGKKQKLKFFSEQPQDIHILFDLYNYNSDFEIIDNSCIEKTLQEEQKIIENYKLFLNSLTEIEHFCLSAYQDNNIYFSEYPHTILECYLPNLPKVNNLTQLYRYVKPAQVYISSHCYEVRLKFLYCMADSCIYGFINDNGQAEMDIKSGLDTFQVNPITGTHFIPPYELQ